MSATDTPPATIPAPPNVRTEPDGRILIERDYTHSDWSDYCTNSKQRRHHTRVITLSSSTDTYSGQPQVQALATVTFAGQCWLHDDTPPDTAIGFRGPITLQRYYQSQLPATFTLTWNEVEILHHAISDWLRDHGAMPPDPPDQTDQPSF